ncbi:MAG TPA: methylenetetrahydrofolate reductase [Candidatus Binataceae bacterium]|jgi:5,10-methylenetetrahydrofolate reductase|nr:methylenetetrahydrofolate reductase [Candidatus Binataceae bacterium]
MSKLLEQLAGSVPSLWIEVSPPRGINTEALLGRLAVLRNKVDAINLTDNSMAKVKLSGLIFAIIIKQRLGIPVALNFSCRDRNLLALKSDLLGAAAVGLDAVVALTGDKVQPDSHAEARSVHDVDVFGLLRVIGELNRGDTGEGKRPLKTLPVLTVGAVANPNRGNFERELELLARKASGGARFVITQPVFDLERAERFLDQASAMGLHVVLGILPVKRAEMANYLKQQVRDLSEVGEHFDRYAGLSEAQSRRLSIEHSLELMGALASRVAGFNIMSGGGPSLAIELALEFDRQRSGRPQSI